MAADNFIKSLSATAVVAIISAIALSHLDRITEPVISRQEIRKTETALAVVLNGFNAGEEKIVTIDGAPFHYWEGERKEGDIIKKAFAFISSGQGHGGTVKSMVGVDDSGTVTGIYIMEQNEAPGPGARCMESPVNYSIADLGRLLSGEISTTREEPRPWFQQQFAGLNAGRKITVEKKGDWNPDMSRSLLEANAITGITGAPVTGRAVISCIEKGYAALLRVQAANQTAEAAVK